MLTGMRFQSGWAILNVTREKQLLRLVRSLRCTTKVESAEDQPLRDNWAVYDLDVIDWLLFDQTARQLNNLKMAKSLGGKDSKRAADKKALREHDQEE